MIYNWLALAVAILSPKEIDIKTALRKMGVKALYKKATKDTDQSSPR